MHHISCVMCACRGVTATKHACELFATGRHGLQFLREALGLPEPLAAHRAMDDVVVLAQVLAAVAQRHGSPSTVHLLHCDATAASLIEWFSDGGPIRRRLPANPASAVRLLCCGHLLAASLTAGASIVKRPSRQQARQAEDLMEVTPEAVRAAYIEPDPVALEDDDATEALNHRELLAEQPAMADDWTRTLSEPVSTSRGLLDRAPAKSHKILTEGQTRCYRWLLDVTSWTGPGRRHDCGALTGRAV